MLDWDHFSGSLSRWMRLPTLLLAALIVSTGCGPHKRSDLDYSYDVYQTFVVPELNDAELVQFETVFWEPDDTESLRKLITDDRIADRRKVLEIGTGTGLLSLVALFGGATDVVATDINPAAVANARYNAAMVEMEENFDVRLVNPDQPGAFSVIGQGERFDLIVSNPPWEDGKPAEPSEHAFYDPNFSLMDSILEGLPTHLNPGGRCLLAYGHLPAITRLLSRVEQLSYSAKVLDDRDLAELPRDFLPGVLIEVRLGKDLIPKADPSHADPALPSNRDVSGK